MKVLYDFDGFKNKFGGVGRCTVELIANLPKDIKYELAFAVSDNSYLKEAGIAPYIRGVPLNTKSFLKNFNFKGKGRLFDFLEKNIRRFPSFNNINKPISINALIRQDFDIFHCTSTDCDTYFLEYLQGKPFVLTVHDMISELFGMPGNHQIQVKKKLVPLASHIIAVSQRTKEDLMRFIDVPEDKITVVYHGSPDSGSYKRYKIYDFPYFLYVGNRHDYKNFIQTLKDFALFHNNHPEVHLVAVGVGFSSTELNLIKQLHLEKYVGSISASEEQLCNLYRYAIAFIFPSLYEGFGIPILESFSYSCPALLNDTSCFPEIAEDAAVYFHSRPVENVSDLAEKMEFVYGMDLNERDALIKKGIKRASYFNWKKSAEQLADVFRKVGGANKVYV